MQDAATVLDVIGKRGARGLPVERLYRQLFNPQLFLMAYGKLYSNRGAMTPGVTGETVDGMSLAKIGAIIGALRAERYRWQPVKRVYIEKKNSSKKRPLGLPTWSDKLVAEVVRLLLEAYYEPQFSDRSHGFRPGRGCHTALSEVVDVWKGTHWFIEGDISDCFGSLDHEVMLATLAEKIHDGRFLQLVSRMLKAGYLEDWTWHATLSGSPQGGIASPVLSNVYLDRLDQLQEPAIADLLRQGRQHDLMVKRPEAVGDVPFDEPGCPGPGFSHVRERGMASPSGAETVRAAGKLRLVICLEEQADHFADKLIRPGRQAERPELPVLFLDIDTFHRGEPVALTAQRIDDAPDLAQRHVVHGLPVSPGRHRPVVGVQTPIGQQVQVRVEQLPVQLIARQATPAAITEDIQYRCGALHYAYLPALEYPVTWPPSPCGRLSRPPW